MKIIINTTNLKEGGAIQVALSLINELKCFDDNKYFVFLSKAVEKQIVVEGFANNFRFSSFDYPSRFTLTGNVKVLDKAAKEIKPDCVFSVFGPTYWTPKFPHVMGFAQGLYLYGELPYFKVRSLKTKIRWTLLKYYHRFLLKKNADFYIVETEDVKKRLLKFLNLTDEKISVVSNTCSSSFFETTNNSPKYLPATKKNEFRLLTISAYYEHKNIGIFKDVSQLLQKEKIQYIFIVTLSESAYKQNFAGFEKSIINVGPIANRDCPSLYSECDAMILPTLVECFSASYPEAMVMGKPILTSDYSFSRTICGNAAIYFDPFDPSDIASNIIRLSNDSDLYANLVQNGLNNVNGFETAKTRCEKYLKICKELIRERKYI